MKILSSPSLNELGCAGSAICCYQNGVNSKIILLRSLNQWICSSSSTLDRLRAALHTVLAPSTFMGFGVLVAGVCCRWLAPELLSWHQKERTTERFQEKRVGRLKICSSNLQRRITFLLSVSYFSKFRTQASRFVCFQFDCSLTNIYFFPFYISLFSYFSLEKGRMLSNYVLNFPF